MKISSIATSCISFKNWQSRDEKYRYLQEKRAYIDEKTDVLSNFSNLTLIGALMTGVFDSNYDTQGKVQRPGKWCTAFVIATCVLIIAKWLGQFYFANKFDMENQK